jgi:aminomethyltransferase
MTTAQLLTTPLHQWHVDHGGRMVDFAGWSMPVQYGSIIDEHVATRTGVGMFDVSHMGRFVFHGPDAETFLDSITTRRIIGIKPGQIRYSLVANDEGGILDDILVYRLAHSDGAPFFGMVVNASNRIKIRDWIRKHQGSFKIDFHDKTAETGMIAVQGPRAVELIEKRTHVSLSQMKYYTGVRLTVFDAPALISRTGYTGEDGCEIIAEAEDVQMIWERIHQAGQTMGLMAAGLGARDTLRLEAGMPLYGHELTEATNPAQTGLDFAVHLEDREFIGKSAIEAARKDPKLPRRIGLEIDGKRAAREGCSIYRDGTDVGAVTSGSFSPTLQKSVSMAYVRPDCVEPGIALAVDVRGSSLPARVVGLPFYTRPR